MEQKASYQPTAIGTALQRAMAEIKNTRPLKKRIIPRDYDGEIKQNKMLVNSIAKGYEPDYEFDDYNRHIFNLLLMYFHGDENFEKQKHGGRYYSLNKGLLISGPVGSGKTLLMRIFETYLRATDNPNKFIFSQVREIEQEFESRGYDAITQYTFNPVKNEHQQTRKQPYCLMIDDLGIETNIMHYGNKTNIIYDILYDRYVLFQHHGILTHATTNCDAETIKRTYPDRLVSRIKEMFNFIPLTGVDRRG